jgi:hypothetical protein
LKYKIESPKFYLKKNTPRISMISLCSPRVVDFYTRSGLDPERMNELLVDLLETVLVKSAANDPEIIRALRELTAAQSAHATGVASMLEAARAATAADATERAAQITKAGEQFTEKLALLLPQAQHEAARRLHDELARGAAQQEPVLLANLELKLVAHQQALQAQLQLSREEQIGRRVVEDQLHTQLGGFLQTMHSSHTKGQVSEKQLGALLVELFPAAEVVNTTGHTAAGDFVVKRQGKPDLLVENKTYIRNVDRVEVDKFVRDVLLRRSCGLFLSQRTGIVGKEDFEIDVQDGLVFLYAHAVDMDPGRIRAAVNIIDSLSARLAAIVEAECDTGIAIPRAVLDEVNAQYRAFEKRRSEMLAAVKEHGKTMTTLLGALELPALSGYLSGSYLTERTEVCKCAICGFVATAGPRGLASHMRKHK